MSLLLKDDILRLAQDPTNKLLGDSFLEENIESSSYDLRIGAVFRQGVIYSNEINQEKNFMIEIQPSEIVTILTLEEIKLPLNISGTVFALNSLSSTGFLILNPGHIDPGFHGPVSICAVNLSKSTIVLNYGKKIFTLVLEKLERNASPYPNKLFKTRKEREQFFLRDKASKLSNSFFDLIKENEYTPLLKKLIKQAVLNLFYKGISIVAGVIATLYAGFKIYEIYSTNNLDKKKLEILGKNNRQLEIERDSLKNVIFYRDSLERYEVQESDSSKKYVTKDSSSSLNN